MRDVLRLVVALAVAVAVHTAVSHLLPWFPSGIDLFIIVALLSSLGRSPAWSAVTGSICGLVADAMSGGYFGLYGFANTLAVWGSAQTQQRIVLQQPLSVGLLMTGATAVQMAVLALLHAFLLAGSEIPSPQTMLLRMATSGILGAALFVSGRRLARFEKAWRERRGRRLRIE